MGPGAATGGLDREGLDALRQAIIGAQRGAKPFTLNLTPQGGSRTLVIHGAAAPAAVGGPGSVLLWLSDATDGEQALAQTRPEHAEGRASTEEGRGGEEGVGKGR